MRAPTEASQLSADVATAHANASRIRSGIVPGRGTQTHIDSIAPLPADVASRLTTDAVKGGLFSSSLAADSGSTNSRLRRYAAGAGLAAVSALTLGLAAGCGPDDNSSAPGADDLNLDLHQAVVPGEPGQDNSIIFADHIADLSPDHKQHAVDALRLMPSTNLEDGSHVNGILVADPDNSGKIITLDANNELSIVPVGERVPSALELPSEPWTPQEGDVVYLVSLNTDDSKAPTETGLVVVADPDGGFLLVAPPHEASASDDSITTESWNMKRILNDTMQGGMLVDANGNLVGIATTEETIAYAVSVEELPDMQPAAAFHFIPLSASSLKAA